MSATLRLEPRIATQWENCWRCRELGIDQPTIDPGEEFVAVIIDGIEHPDKTCADCFSRLQEEIADQP